MKQYAPPPLQDPAHRVNPFCCTFIEHYRAELDRRKVKGQARSPSPKAVSEPKKRPPSAMVAALPPRERHPRQARDAVEETEAAVKEAVTAVSSRGRSHNKTATSKFYGRAHISLTRRRHLTRAQPPRHGSQKTI